MDLRNTSCGGQKVIIDQIANIKNYIPLVSGLKKVIEILESGALKGAVPGKYTTDDPSIRYVVMAYTTKIEKTDEYEIHRKEIDIQILLKGSERMDLILPEPVKLAKEYIAESDAGFVSGEKSVSYYASENTFAVFFPGEPHAPSLIDGDPSEVLKVVFKIRCQAP
jgi:YhcH/YjgK/YiaL family protein